MPSLVDDEHRAAAGQLTHDPHPRLLARPGPARVRMSNAGTIDKPPGPCSRNRRHHRHAVVRDIPISAATCATARPDWMRWTMINLPAGVSRALAWDKRDLRAFELKN